MRKIMRKFFGKKNQEESVNAKREAIDDLVGKVVQRPGKCDECPLERTDCKKVDIRGIGDVCLVNGKE